MSEECDICGRNYIPNSDRKRVIKSCSNYCSQVFYEKKRKIRQIESNKYHTMKVSLIESLGYKVTITKVIPSQVE